MNDSNFDRIESYLFGQMTAAARAAFERELAENPALANELALQKAEHRAMELMLQQDLRDNMAAWQLEKKQADENRSQMRVGFSRRQIMQWAAAASVVLVAGFWWLSVRQLDPAALLDDSATAMKGSSADVPAALAPAFEAMKKEDFATAITLLEAAQTDPDFGETARLLRAECYFRLKNYDAAAAQMLPVAQSPTAPENGEKAEWMLLLAHWAKGDKKEAARWRDKILADPGHTFRKEAERVKDEF